jgi:TonB family protein
MVTNNQFLIKSAIPIAKTLACVFIFLACFVHGAKSQNSTNSTALTSSTNWDQMQPYPSYPNEAILRKWQGIVILRVVVSPDCHPSSVTIKKSSGHDILDQAAIKAVEKWYFPKKAVGTNEIPVTFKLQSNK